MIDMPTYGMALPDGSCPLMIEPAAPGKTKISTPFGSVVADTWILAHFASTWVQHMGQAVMLDDWDRVFNQKNVGPFTVIQGGKGKQDAQEPTQ